MSTATQALPTPHQPAQRRPSITQRLSSLIPGRRGDSPAQGSRPGKERAPELEGGAALERTVSPLEQANALLTKYQPAQALSIYSAALKECATPVPSSPTLESADPLLSISASGSASASASGSTSAPAPGAALATSPGGSIFIPTEAEKLELELKHALCRLKVGHCSEALAGARKVIAKVDAKEAAGGAAGLTEDDKQWRKKAKWIEETAKEGKEYDGGAIPAR